MILLVTVCSSCINKKQLTQKPLDQRDAVSMSNIQPVCFHCGRTTYGRNLTEIHVSPTNYVKWSLLIGFMIGVLVRWIF